MGEKDSTVASPATEGKQSSDTPAESPAAEAIDYLSTEEPEVAPKEEPKGSDDGKKQPEATKPDDAGGSDDGKPKEADKPKGKDAKPEEPKDKPPEEKGDEAETKVASEIDRLTSDPENDPPKDPSEDDPEQAIKDEEWRSQLPEKTKRRFDRLFSRIEEQREQIESQAPLIESGEKVSELLEMGITEDEIDMGHSLMAALKQQPVEAEKLLVDILDAVRKEHGIEAPASASSDFAMPDLSEVTVGDDYQAIVDAGYLKPEHAKLLSYLDAKQDQPKGEPAPEAKKPAEPEGGGSGGDQGQGGQPAEQGQGGQGSDGQGKPADDGPTASELIGKFLNEEGVDVGDHGDLFHDEMAPVMIRMAKEDDLDPYAMTPKQKLRYAKLAYREVRPPKPAEVPREPEIHTPLRQGGPGGGGPGGGSELSPTVRGAIADLTGTE